MLANKHLFCEALDINQKLLTSLYLKKKLIPEDLSRDEKQGFECLHCQWPNECVFYNLHFQTVITTSFSTIFVYLN